MSENVLLPCPSCARYVRQSEPSCPFCSAALPSAFREQTVEPSPARRLNRAALYALRMGAVSMAATACGGSVTVAGDGGGEGHGDSAADDDSGQSGSDDAGREQDAPYTVASYGGFIGGGGPVYGGFYVPDAGQPVNDAGAQVVKDAEPDVRFIAPPYGAFPGVSEAIRPLPRAARPRSRAAPSSLPPGTRSSRPACTDPSPTAPCRSPRSPSPTP